MGSGFSKRKKQAKQMQEQFAAMQEELSNLEVEGEAGHGLVKITLNGDHEIKKLTIQPDCIDPEDIEGLEDLIREAHQKALEQLRAKSNSFFPGDLGRLPF